MSIFIAGHWEADWVLGLPHKVKLLRDEKCLKTGLKNLICSILMEMFLDLRIGEAIG
jgi:hypothetical protein